MAVFGLTIGLSSGFSVITGQRFGAEDMDGVRRSVATSAMLALVITLMLTACVSLAMPLIMRLMNISDVLYDDAYHYMLIVVLGLVAMMSYNLLSCICRALGDSRTPLYFPHRVVSLEYRLGPLFIVAFWLGRPRLGHRPGHRPGRIGRALPVFHAPPLSHAAPDPSRLEL